MPVSRSRRRQPRKAKAKTARRETAFVQALAKIRRTQSIQTGLAAYRLSASRIEISTTLPHFLAIPAYNRLVWPAPFPKSFNELGFGGLPGLTDFERELTWNIQALLPHATALNEFISLKEECEQAFFRGTTETIRATLLSVQNKFGVSLWLAEMTINYLQYYEGYRQQRKYSLDVLSHPKLHPLCAFLISWLSFRAEQNVSAAEFYRHLETNHPLTDSVSSLTHVFLGACPKLPASNAAHALAFTDILPVIDRYLLTISVLQIHLASCDDHVISPEIGASIASLTTCVRDFNLRRIATVCGLPTDLSTHLRQLSISDFYAAGDYSAVISSLETTASETISIDAIYLHIESQLQQQTSPSRPAIFRKDSLVTKIYDDLAAVLSFSVDAGQAIQRLQKIIANFTNSSWAAPLALILQRLEHDERIHGSTPSQTFYALRAPDDGPILAFCFDRIGAAQIYLDHLASYGDSVTTRLTNAIWGRTEAPADVVQKLPPERVFRVNALIYIRNNELEAAINLLHPLFANATVALVRGKSGLLLSEILLRSGKLMECADVCVTLFDLSSLFAKLLPLRRLLEELIQLEKNCETPSPDIYGHLAIVNAFDIFSHHVSPAYDEIRTDAFKDFLTVQRVRYASELARDVDKFPRTQLIYFLNHVCVPAVLDQSLALTSTRAVEDERARILVLLSELCATSGKTPPAEFMEELRTIKTRQIVRDTTLQLDQSKIYVNVEGIKKATAPQLRESWQRYRLITLQQGTGLIELQKALEEKLGQRITLVSLTLPLTEGNKLFARMVLQLRDSFAISKEFGLDANLSTNIRHGFILRELRGPFLLHHLVTNKVTEVGSYQRNDYWLDRLEQLGDYRLDQVNAALTIFSESIDQEIEHLNRHLLRIRSEQAPDGLFDFTVNDVGIQVLQRALENADDYDSFIDGIIEFLWKLTGEGLEKVRNVLYNDTIRMLNAAVSDLQSKLRTIAIGDELAGLLSATNLARTDLLSAVNRVASWFTLSDNVEYQDYSLQIAYEAGLATVRAYYSHLKIRSEFLSNSIMMAGRTLPFFARLFSMLVDNCAAHSGVVEGDLQIACEAHRESGILYIGVRNALAASIDMEKLTTRIQHINTEFGREPSSEVIRQEGGSGYPKMWKILAHDLGGDHALEVSLTPNREFLVQIMLDEKGLVL